MVVAHLVLFTLGEAFTEELNAQATVGIKGLLQIPGALEAQWAQLAPGAQHNEQGFTHGVYVLLDEPASLDRYAGDPLHVAFVNKYIKPFSAGAVALDIESSRFERPDPVSLTFTFRRGGNDRLSPAVAAAANAAARDMAETADGLLEAQFGETEVGPQLRVVLRAADSAESFKASPALSMLCDLLGDSSPDVVSLQGPVHRPHAAGGAVLPETRVWFLKRKASAAPWDDEQTRAALAGCPLLAALQVGDTFTTARSADFTSAVVAFGSPGQPSDVAAWRAFEAAYFDGCSGSEMVEVALGSVVHRRGAVSSCEQETVHATRG